MLRADRVRGPLLVMRSILLQARDDLSQSSLMRDNLAVQLRSLGLGSTLVGQIARYRQHGLHRTVGSELGHDSSLEVALASRCRDDKFGHLLAPRPPRLAQYPLPG